MVGCGDMGTMKPKLSNPVMKLYIRYVGTGGVEAKELVSTLRVFDVDLEGVPGREYAERVSQHFLSGATTPLSIKTTTGFIVVTTQNFLICYYYEKDNTPSLHIHIRVA